MPNYSDYQKSISSEIISVKDRLRNFIDDHHWPEDGRYKEVILSDILRKHLPKTVSVGTGFIAAGNRLSTQIDIIIYRNDTPLLFQQSDFVIVAPESVLGVIEAKSNIPNSSMLCDVVNKLSNVRSLVSHEIFTGIFAFEGYDCLRQNSQYWDNFYATGQSTHNTKVKPRRITAYMQSGSLHLATSSQI